MRWSAVDPDDVGVTHRHRDAVTGGGLRGGQRRLQVARRRPGAARSPSEPPSAVRRRRPPCAASPRSATRSAGRALMLLARTLSRCSFCVVPYATPRPGCELAVEQHHARADGAPRAAGGWRPACRWRRRQRWRSWVGAVRRMSTTTNPSDRGQCRSRLSGVSSSPAVLALPDDLAHLRDVVAAERVHLGPETRRRERSRAAAPASPTRSARAG